MKNKIIILMIIFVLCMTFVSSKSFNSGEVVNVDSIINCEGPVKIDIESKQNLSKQNLFFEKCVREKGFWVGECSKKFDIVFKTNENFTGSFDIKVQYYLNYIKPIKNDTNNSNSIAFVNNEVEKRLNHYENFTIKEKEIVYNYNITDEMKDFIKMFFIIVFVIVFLIIVIFSKYMFSKEEENYDIMNYKVK